MRAARRAYEGEPRCSFSKLAERFGLGRNLIAETAREEGWCKFAPTAQDSVRGVAEGRQVEAAILVAGLQPPTSPAPRRGRPSKHLRIPGAAPLTDEQNRLLAAREEYAQGGHHLRELAEKYGFTPGKLHYVCKIQGWERGPDPTLPSEAAPAEDRLPEPASQTKKRRANLKLVADGEGRTADIVAFPKAAQPASKKAAAMSLLPPMQADEKQKLRVTLAAIRAMMSVEQVQQLERHEQLLARYAHLVEVYLEPHRFVDPQGPAEDADEYAERVWTAQRTALRMLLPTERDTLAGAIKVLTEAMKHTIELKRTVAGLGKTLAGAYKVGANIDMDPDEAARAGGKILDIDVLETRDLRAVQHAMELLDRQHRRQTEPPKPPPPDSIDDLLGAPPVVVQEAEDPSAAPR
jgi:hypothetical protein